MTTAQEQNTDESIHLVEGEVAATEADVGTAPVGSAKETAVETKGPAATVQDTAEQQDTDSEKSEESVSSRRKRSKTQKVPKRVYKNLLPHVTRMRSEPLKRNLPDLDFSGTPKYLTSLYMDRNVTPLVFKQDILSEQQYRYPFSYIKGSLATYDMPKLRATIAYLIKNGLITHPENFVNYYKARPYTEAEEIFLHELFKEPQHVIEAAYQVGNNLKSYEAFANRKRYDPISGEDVSLNLNTSEYEYKTPTDLPAYEAIDDDIYYLDINDKGVITLLANAGQPTNDPELYWKFPVRLVTGFPDGTDHRIEKLCGEETDRFVRRTANELLTHPDIEAHGNDAEVVRRYMRRLCPLEPYREEPIMKVLERNYDYSQMLPLDEKQVQDLIQYGDGWTMERIKKAYTVEDE